MNALRVVHWPEEPVQRVVANLGAEMPEAARLTLREYYEREMLPARQLRNAKSTLQSDLVCIRRWEQWGRTKPKRWRMDQWGKPITDSIDGEPISNPPIGLIVSSDLTAFVTELRQHVAPKTVQTTVRTLSVMLNHAGPSGPRSRHAQDVLLRCPAFPAITVPIARKFMPRPQHVTQLLQASLQLPERLQPLARALVLTLCAFGIRPRDACRMRRSSFDQARNELQWTARKTERHKPYPVVTPVPAPVAAALSVLQQQPINPKSQRLLCSYQLALKLWRRLLRLAKLDERIKDSRGRRYYVFNMKSLRRFTNDRLNSIRPGAGDWVLGHAINGQSKVNHEHYSECYVAPDWVRSALLSPEYSCFLVADQALDHGATILG